MNNEPYGWVKNGEYVLYIEKPDSVFNYIPLYTHQYERPHNTVLVPCDKLAEMQAEINALKKEAALQRLSDFTQEAECKHGVDDGACKECYQEVTHPVKELTDEEIGDFEYQIIRACGLSTANSDINPIGLRQIIKAILRKAQEK